jgi:hypothetical protein
VSMAGCHMFGPRGEGPATGGDSGGRTVQAIPGPKRPALGDAENGIVVRHPDQDSVPVSCPSASVLVQASFNGEAGSHAFAAIISREENWG